MLSIPFLNTREKLVVVADIGSASAGVALGVFKGDQLTIIAGASLEASPTDRSRAHAVSTVSSLFSDAVKKVQTEYADFSSKKTYGPPEYGVIVVESPWSNTSVRSAERAFDKSERITKEIIGDLAREALSCDDVDGQVSIVKERILESTVIRVLLNGYKTARPVGKYARHIAVYVVVSDGEPDIMKMANEVFKNQFGITKPKYRSGARALLGAIREEAGGGGDYFVAHITDGSMYFLVVREGIPTTSSTIPIGLHEVLRRISGKQTPEEIFSIFSMIERNACSKEACVLFKELLAKVEPELVRAVGDSMAELSRARKLPESMYLYADPRVSAWFSSLFSRIDFEQFTVTAQPFRVKNVTFSNDSIHYMDEVHPDLSLKVALQLVNTENTSAT